jgi:hypothetical protein
MAKTTPIPLAPLSLPQTWIAATILLSTTVVLDNEQTGEVKTLCFLRGLPASGKTTWANGKLAPLNIGGKTMAVRTSKDEIREQRGAIIESKVISIETELVTEALKAGLDVIMDNTHFHPESRTPISASCRKVRIQVRTEQRGSTGRGPLCAWTVRRQESGQYLCGCAQNNLVEAAGVERLLRADICGADAPLLGSVYEARCGIDRTRRAYNKKGSGAFEFLVDAFHVERNFTEPDDMRTHGCATIEAFGKLSRCLVQLLIRAVHIAPNASRLEKCAVHVMDPTGPCALVKVINVLSAEIEPVVQLHFDLSKGNVGSIWLGSKGIPTTHGVELPDEFGIGVPGFGRRNLLDTVPLPEPAGAAKGSEPTLCGDSGARENKEAIMESQMHNKNETPFESYCHALKRDSILMPRQPRVHVELR